MSDSTDASPKGLLVLFAIFVLLITFAALNIDALVAGFGALPR
jgi:hypothetical protein